MLTIGISLNPWDALFGTYSQQRIKALADKDCTIAYYANDAQLLDALVTGAVDVVPKPLKDLTTNLPNGIVITALEAIDKKHNVLIINKNAFDSAAQLHLKTQRRVWANNRLQAAQLREVRDDIVIESFSAYPLEAYQFLEDGLYDAIQLTALSLKFIPFDETKYCLLSLNPKEFITDPGQGTTAYLTAADARSVRQLLRSLHDTNTSKVTNVERQLKKLNADKDIAAYCYQDEQSNFHLWASALVNGILKKTRLSQSTSFELAERCYERLML